MAPAIHLTRASANAKTGPIPVSTSSRATCPSTCSFKGAGCYAENFPLSTHWNAVTAGRGLPWADFVDEISRLKKGQLWRHNQAGDLAGQDDVIDVAALRQLTRANRGKKGFTYTHYPPTPANLKAIRAAVKGGFAVNLSADSLLDADRLAVHGLPLVVVVPPGWREGKTPAGHKVTLCPAQTMEYMTCAVCKLCANTERHAIVAFEAHGARRRTVIKIIEEKATAES
jgi:hypothetical protein